LLFLIETPLCAVVAAKRNRKLIGFRSTIMPEQEECVPVTVASDLNERTAILFSLN
jgi:hypothetical protein